MTSDMMTINSTSRMLRQIPVQKHQPSDMSGDSFADCIRSASDSDRTSVKAVDVSEYRQMLYDKFQSMPFNTSNRMDTTMISISDAGIHRMMKDPEYEEWVCSQVRTLFSANDWIR